MALSPRSPQDISNRQQSKNIGLCGTCTQDNRNEKVGPANPEANIDFQSNQKDYACCGIPRTSLFWLNFDSCLGYVYKPE